MKIGHIVLGCVLICCGVANAQVYQPVQNNLEEVDVKEEAFDTKKDDTLMIEEADTSIHFAQRHKDLAIAKEWLQQEYSHSTDKNIVISPLAFYLTSVVLANGVVDDSLLEFSNLFSVLKLSDVGQKLNSYLYREKDSIFINFSLWGAAFSERYQKMMAEQFGAEIWGIKETTSAINDWAATRTKGAIKKIAPVKEVIENALYVGTISYFKGLLSLKNYSVKEEEFGGKKGKVSMLYAQTEVDYYEDEEKQAVRLPCGNGDMLTILLPKVDFAEFIEDLDIYNLVPAFHKRDKINLAIPVLDFEYNALFTKNVYDIFDIHQIFMKGNYGFAKMVNFDEDIYLQDLFMRTKINIGGQDVSNTVEEDEKLERSFKANRPFVFVINKGDFIGTFVRGN